MKRVETVVPAENREEVEAIITEYDEPAVSEIEKDERKFLKFEVALDSEDIDEITEKLKDIKELETGELTIDVLDETAFIEKGVRRRGGTQSISVQEMYTKAFSFSTFDSTSWALIALATGIAVFGAVTENVLLVIGAMVIAPMLGPFMSASFGLVIGDKKIIEESLFYGLLSILFAMAVAFILGIPIPLRPNPLIHLISQPGFVTIPLSLSVGAASALTFATEARESLAGVAIAIALVPPSAVAGLALAMPNMDIFFNVMLVILSNVMALILAGSLTFKALGIKPSTYYRKKVSEKHLTRALYVSTAIILLIGGVVGYISYQDLQNTYTRADINSFLEEEFGNRIIQKNIEVTRSEAHITLSVVEPSYTEEQLQSHLSEITSKHVETTLIGIEGVS